MFNKINNLFTAHKNVLNLYTQRQEILASNIANADTPGYQAKDIDFKNALSNILNDKKISFSQIQLKRTANNHLKEIKNQLFEHTPQINIFNKNSVDMNQERVKFVENSLKYQASLLFFKNEMKNMIDVIKG